MNLPELQRISQDEMKKIYPQKYFAKYARHVNVLQYQQQVLRQDQENRFQRINLGRRQSKPQIPEVPVKREYNPRYDDFKTIIEQNKFEASRMAKFSRALTLKLETTPEKKVNMIRSPAKEKGQVDQNLLDRLKAIEDLEYERVLKQRQKRKKFLQQKSICKFIRRARSNQVSPRHSNYRYQTTESNQVQSVNPELKTINSTIEYKNKSKLIPIHSKDLSRYKSLSIDQNLIKKVNKMEMETVQSANLGVKRNLIEETRKIRMKVESMETFSYYDALLLKKKRQELLSLL